MNGTFRGFVWRFDPNFGSVFNQLIDKLKSKDKVLQDEINYKNYLDGSVQIAGCPVNTFVILPHYLCIIKQTINAILFNGFTLTGS